MKKLGLGIAILLFSLLFHLCSSGLDMAALVIGIIGLGLSIAGFMDKSN